MILRRLFARTAQWTLLFTCVFLKTATAQTNVTATTTTPQNPSSSGNSSSVSTTLNIVTTADSNSQEDSTTGNAASTHLVSVLAAQVIRTSRSAPQDNPTSAAQGGTTHQLSSASAAQSSRTARSASQDNPTSAAQGGSKASQDNSTSAAQVSSTTQSTPLPSSTSAPHHIEGLSAETLNTTAIKLTWEVQNLDNYTYQVNVSGCTSASRVVAATLGVIIIDGLPSGTNCTFTVKVQNAREGEEAKTSGYTKPHSIGSLTAETVNTTAVYLQWELPAEYQSTYQFQVHTSGCLTPQASNTTIKENNITLTDLKPGTNCTFTVSVITQDGVEGEAKSISNYTKPETVLPNIYNNEGNDTIIVSWKRPDGKVESYEVLLRSRNGTQTRDDLGGSALNVTFSNLSAGTIYNATVITKSGLFREESGENTTATYPNPPENITRVDQATNSIYVEWTPAFLMTNADGFNYSVTISNVLEENSTKEVQYHVTDFNVTDLNVRDLRSGTPHEICVKTAGPLGFNSEKVCRNVTTKPHAIGSLTAETLNTTAVFLQWEQPKEYQSTYQYQVQTSGCLTPPQTNTTIREEITLTHLTPGTNCTFTISVITEDYVVGEAKSISNYTKPETVLPNISNNQSNDTITVSWKRPGGKVESYEVLLRSRNGTQTRDDLGGSALNVTFSNLSAGTTYSATVITKSGLFREESGENTTATYPNPPENITRVDQATNSIYVEWTPAFLMTNADGFNYSVTISNVLEENSTKEVQYHVTDFNVTDLNVRDLRSGTPHVICVKTAGPLGFNSEKVCRNVTTKPHAIGSLTAETLNTTAVFLQWEQPKEYQSTYQYQVQTSGCLTPPQTNTTIREEITLTHLTPGTNCTFTISVITEDYVVGEAKSISNYTKPETVLPNISNNQSNDTITVSWKRPGGKVESYEVLLRSRNGTQTRDDLGGSALNVTFSNLSAGTTYSATVITKSGLFREESGENTTATYPNPPENITRVDQATNSIYVEWTPAFLMTNADGFNYSVTISNVLEENSTKEVQYHVTDFNVTDLNVRDLRSGTPHEICVKTAGTLGFNSEKVCRNVTTKPHAIGSLTAETLSTTAVFLQWEQPEEYQSTYQYQVQTSGCLTPPQTNTTIREEITLTHLTPGTNCTFTISVITEDYVVGEAKSISNYTKPETVLPNISNNQSNDTITVSWKRPKGNVESYEVLLRSRNGTQTRDDLGGSALNVTFSNLSAGTIYSATVITKSGLFREESGENTTATYPNPPENITRVDQATNSIYVEWTPAFLMTNANGFNYSVTISNVLEENNTKEVQYHVTDFNVTDLNVRDLRSGTPHEICVKTAGPLGFNSEKVCRNVTTKPHSIGILTAETLNTTAVFLQWEQPEEYQSTYQYQVQTSGCLIPPQTNTTSREEITLTHLTPGTNCTFTISVITEDYVVGEAKSISNYTKPETVLPNISNNQSNDTITVSWKRPGGKVESYEVLLRSRNGTQTRDDLGGSALNVTFSNLSAGTRYTATVITKSGLFREESRENTTATYPNPPENITRVDQATNSIYIEWTPAFLMTNADGFNYYVTISNVLEGNSTKEVQYHVTDRNVTDLNVTDLRSGTPHVICVKTAGPLGFNSEKVCRNVITKPQAIGSLTAETLSTTAVFLQWEQPEEYQSTYQYQVQTSGCLIPPQLNTTIREEITLTHLTPGTNCIFTISIITEDYVVGEAKSISKYTKPETVQPFISNNQSNDTIIVSWKHPKGNVESYEVCLNSSSDNRNVTLNQNVLNTTFSNLSAGAIYTATVTTKSGPFSETSSFVTTATYPNPPRDITIISKTTSSIDVSWSPADLMNESDGFSYMVTIGNVSENSTKDKTSLLNRTLPNLRSGAPYFICVKTVGPLNFDRSSPCISVTTRPESIRSLQVSDVKKEIIEWKWTEPPDWKKGYEYHLKLTNDANSYTFNKTTRDVTYKFGKLTPGVNYTVTVTTLTSDGTNGKPVYASSCTDTSGLKEITCNGENQTPSAQLDLEWQEPEGQNIGFKISIRAMTNYPEEVYAETQESCSPCEHNINENLKYGTEYNVTVWTRGCGHAGSISIKCKTGVTAPPPVTDSAKVKVKVTSHNTIQLTLDRSDFLDPSSGPIEEYGVLVSDSTNPDFRPNDLAKTYSDWKDKKATNYLATIQEPPAVSRSLEESEIIVTLGDNHRSHCPLGDNHPSNCQYVNGPLTPTKTYRFAVVTCTALVLSTGRVDPDKSICSISPFSSYSLTLHQDPVVIVTASGATVGVLVFLLIIAIGVFIFLKRKTFRRHDTDIPFSTMRTKTNVPVQIEEFDAYFKKQNANTKCGFAEDFEDFKPVGTAQSTATASALENKSKNRYSNVLPYEPARVKLSILSSQFDDYINASYVPGENSRKEFIACQGPLPVTVNDFWRMVWEKNVRTIVMLTRCNEQGRVKCEQYWPPESKHFNNIIVTTTSEIALDDWTLRDFDIKNVKTAETRAVRQFHYTAWPDHGVPETTELLINFRHLVREHMDQHSLHSPTIVHCSAGVGRTGTFIAIDRVIFQIERESKVDVFGIVYEMRMHRPLMVQTEDQYVFLNQSALDIIKSRLGTNVDLIYQNTAATSIYENVKPRNV